MEIVKLRERAGYVSELAKLHFDAWGYLRPHETLSERTARLDETSRALDMPTVLIAVEFGQLLGSATLQASDGLLPDIELTPWLAGVYVKTAHRSRGIAARLIREIETLAFAKGFSTLNLCTHDHEVYYAGLGYRTLATQDFRGEPTSIMAKALG
ncbi:GNAT family N-acetyltransferase [Dyella sp. C11]|uniref:GNAT family N-acetyltransferase n=1 Tax=Dyella sp. C11 TaxID=2126991 RepID=UPI000D645A62|nr:GNAT family N-acetyltransferase [Dyella sp. C11]